jgi:hypothetical protein
MLWMAFSSWYQRRKAVKGFPKLSEWISKSESNLKTVGKVGSYISCAIQLPFSESPPKKRFPFHSFEPLDALQTLA